MSECMFRGLFEASYCSLDSYLASVQVFTCLLWRVRWNDKILKTRMWLTTPCNNGKRVVNYLANGTSFQSGESLLARDTT